MIIIIFARSITVDLDFNNSETHVRIFFYLFNFYSRTVRVAIGRDTFNFPAANNAHGTSCFYRCVPIAANCKIITFYRDVKVPRFCHATARMLTRPAIYKTGRFLFRMKNLTAWILHPYIVRYSPYRHSERQHASK